MSLVAELFIDKSTWGNGPWQHEPDRKQWQHAGFDCLIIRVDSHGALCGYVGVPAGHPWYGKDYDVVDADVHGGLTYSAKCHGRVCHTSQPGESDDIFWFGFDCVHAGDYSPAGNSSLSSFLGVILDDVSGDCRNDYKDINYVTSEVEKLAEQTKSAI